MRWRDKGIRPRHILTANGDLFIQRRYYWLSAKQHVHPADAALGVDEHGLSARACEACCRFSMLASFEDAVAELRRYAGIPISQEFLRQISTREGVRIEHVRESGILPSAFAGAGKKAPTRLYASIDGVFARMVRNDEKVKRRENAEAKRAQMTANRVSALAALPAMRPGHTESFHEMKVGVFYTQDRKRVHSFVTQENSKRAGELIKTHAQHVGFADATERVGLGDGAIWVAGELILNLPELTLFLLDFFHLSQHVYEAARCCLGECEEAIEWGRTRLQEFKTKGPGVALTAMQSLHDTVTTQAKRDSMVRLMGYVEARVPLLRYPEAIARGFDIGSGPMEAQCKTHTLRLKISGAKWDQDHAASMMNLVALHTSSQWEVYWRQRAA